MEDFYDSKLIKSKLTKKKKINSRSKGNAFERKVCALLNDRFNTKEFARTPGSGAFATTHKLPDHLKIYGDLITPKNFRFVIECKKGYNKINLNSIFNHSSDLWDFIKKAERDSEACGKPLIIIFQQDRQDILVISKKETFPQEKSFTEPIKNIEFDNYIINLLEDIIKYDDCFFLF